MLSVAMVRFYTLQDHFSPFAGAMRPRHDSPEPEAAVSLPDLCQNVPRLVELFSAGSAGVLLATCSQLREAVCPLVTKITVTVPDKSIGVDFSVLLNSRWSSIQSLTLNSREVSEQSIHQIFSAGWPYMTSLTFDHCGFGPQTASFMLVAIRLMHCRPLAQCGCSIACLTWPQPIGPQTFIDTNRSDCSLSSPQTTPASQSLPGLSFLTPSAGSHQQRTPRSCMQQQLPSMRSGRLGMPALQTRSWTRMSLTTT